MMAVDVADKVGGSETKGVTNLLHRLGLAAKRFRRSRLLIAYSVCFVFASSFQMRLPKSEACVLGTTKYAVAK